MKPRTRTSAKIGAEGQPTASTRSTWTTRGLSFDTLVYWTAVERAT